MRHLFSFLRSGWLCLLLTLFSVSPLSAESKAVIASAGASGYLMEHNLPSVALAVAMEADLIKQDLVLTRDAQLIVFRDPTLERVTNVAELFPGRSREDGRYHVLDFTLDEIRQLSLHDPADHFPADLHPRLTIPTFSEELAMLRGLEKTLQRTIRIAPEIKQPWLYRKEGHDISQLVLTTLQDFGYGGQEDKVLLLSYDAEELQRIAQNLLPAMGMSIKLIQLIDSNEGSETMVEEWGELVSYNYDWMFSKSGLRSLKRYAAGIGLSRSMLADDKGSMRLPDFVENAHQLEMLVYGLPGQETAQAAPPLDDEFEFIFFTMGVDGLVTDFCGDAVRFLKNRAGNVPPLPAPEENSAPALGGENTSPPPLPPLLPYLPDRENKE